MTQDQLNNIFTYHAPTPAQIEVYAGLRGAGLQMASHINAICPESREKSLAITYIQQAIQMANAAIAIHNGPSTGNDHIKPR